MSCIIGPQSPAHLFRRHESSQCQRLFVLPYLQRLLGLLRKGHRAQLRRRGGGQQMRRCER